MEASKITKQTYSEQVADYIKECILEGKLSPGDQLKEVELASALSISRAPVREALQILTREALQILTREGLVYSVTQKGKYITSLTERQIRDSYYTGGVLEAASAGATVHLFTESDFEKLEELVDKMKDVVENGGSVAELANVDDQFHEILFSKTENDLLIELSRRSCQGISKFLLFRHWKYLFSPEEIYDRHKKILDTLKTKSPWEIEHCIRDHYMESGDRMSRFGSDRKDEIN